MKSPMPHILERLGIRAPVVIAVDGGSSSYFHDRQSGAWGSYVTDVLIPDAERRFHTKRGCVGIAGFSMGGFGAIDIALAHPTSFRLVGLHDAAIWLHSGETAPGAFDDAEDFARHDVVQIAGRDGGKLKHVHVRIDRGTTSPFASGIDALTDALRSQHVKVKTATWPGPHAIRSIRPELNSVMDEYASALDC
jgi:enterochelin esterase-like enzyme